MRFNFLKIIFGLFLYLSPTINYAQTWQYELQTTQLGIFENCGLQSIENGFVAVFQNKLIEMDLWGHPQQIYSLDEIVVNGYDFVQKMKDGYLVGGYVPLQKHIQLTKIGWEGSALWERTFPTDDPHEPVVFSIDSLHLIVATDTALYKINNTTGNTVWQKTVDLNQLVSGISYRDNLVLLSENTLYFKNAKGEEIWQNTLPFKANDVVKTENGYFVVGEELEYLTIAELTETGRYVRSITYPPYKSGFDITKTEDDNYLITGETTDNKIFALKITPTGQRILDKTYREGIGQQIIPTPDGGFIIGVTNNDRLIKADAEGETTAKIQTLFVDGSQELFPNAIKTVGHPNKALFTDDGKAHFSALSLSPASTINGSALLFAGYQANNLHFSNANLGDFQSGYIGSNKAVWEKIWKITADEITEFRKDLEDGTADNPIPYPILTYPALGNPYAKGNFHQKLEITQPLAEFVDVNNDGIYNAYDGDYPKIKGDEWLWSIMNDGKIEVITTIYGYDCAEDEILNQTIFVDYAVTNRTNESFDSVLVGLWTDFELGCFIDDYVGCSPGDNTFYVYNETDIDNSICPSSTPNFGTNLPIQTATFLNQTLDYFTFYTLGGIGTSYEPQTPSDFYNYMTGKWKDGVPFTVGGDGYDPNNSQITNHAFYDNPDLQFGWSMARENISGNDFLTISSTEIGELPANSTIHLTTAYTYHSDISHPFPDVDPLMDNLNQLKNAYTSDWLKTPLYLGSDTAIVEGTSFTLDASNLFIMDYQWSTGSTVSTITIEEGGNYQVTVTNALGCTKSEEINVEVLPNFDKTNDLYTRIYPNPTTDILTVDYLNTGINSDFTIQLYTISGQLLFEVKSDLPNDSLRFNLSDLANGIYILEIQAASKTLERKKVMKIR